MNHPSFHYGRVALTLHSNDGAAWVLTLPADCAQFVGRYPRLPGFGVRGALLDFLPQDSDTQIS